MAQRASKKDLQRTIAAINTQLGYKSAGSTPDGPEFEGALVLDAAYGGYAVNAVSGHGETNLASRGTAKDIMQWLDGFQVGWTYGASAQAGGDRMRENAWWSRSKKTKPRRDWRSGWGPLERVGPRESVLHSYMDEGEYGVMGSDEDNWDVVYASDGQEVSERTSGYASPEAATRTAERL